MKRQSLDEKTDKNSSPLHTGAARVHMPRTKKSERPHAASAHKIIAATEVESGVESSDVTSPITPESEQLLSQETPASDAKKVPQQQHRFLLIGGALALLTLVLVWAVGNIFWSKVAVGNTVVAGRTSNTALQQLVSENAATYRLRVAYPNNSQKSFALQDIGVKIDPAGTVTAIRKAQRSPLQLFEWWRTVSAKPQVKTDNTKFKNFIADNASIVTQPAHDAALAIANGNVQITAATSGKQYGLVNPATAIMAAINTSQTTPLHLAVTTLKPTITEATLASTKTQLQAILQQHISIGIAGQIITPSASDIAAWVTLTPTTSSETLSVNAANLASYLTDLANSNNQPPRSEVVLANTDQVLQAGTRGVAVGDTQGAVDAITQNLLAGKGVQTTLPVQYTAFKTVSAPTLGKWIEVNTTTKRMYAYDQGQLVRSFLVSAGASATPTVTGSFAIYAKYRSQNMFGENVDGSNYFQPNVPYVNYFYQDYAIHGNYWRPASYFGNINSSHGCVGVSVSDGAWMYSWAPIGTPVVVHT